MSARELNEVMGGAEFPARITMKFDDQSIKRMIRSGHFGHYGDLMTWDSDEIRKHADECGVSAAVFSDLMAEVALEIVRERAVRDRRAGSATTKKLKL